MNQKKIKIIYRDGTEEKYYVDNYDVRDGCLRLYTRFGVDSGCLLYTSDAADD